MVKIRIVSVGAVVVAASCLSAAALAAPAPVHAAASAPAPTSVPSGRLLDEVVAVVNNQPILESTLASEEAQVKANLQSQGTPLPSEKQFRHQVLEHLIAEQVQLQAAKNQGIQISTDQVNQTLSEIASRNGLSLAQLPQALAERGGSYAVFRRRVKDQLIIHQLIQQAVATNVEVSPSEVADYLKQEANAQSNNVEYELAQILVPFPTNATPAEAKKTLAKAKSIEAKLKAGANFGATAVAESAGPHALQGGMIGWLKPADLPTLFADTVPGMSAGDISDPIEGVGGYHIVKLIATRQLKSQKSQTQYHLKHILIKPNPVRTLAQAKALAEKLRGEIESGKVSFAEAAKEYSNDPNSAGNGGDLGWQTLNSLPKSFGQAVTTLKPGVISQPVESQYGWHLIEVVGTRKQNVTEAERHNQAYQAIFQRKLADQIAEFKRVLRDQAYVRILNQSAGASNTGTGTGSGD